MTSSALTVVAGHLTIAVACLSPRNLNNPSHQRLCRGAANLSWCARLFRTNARHADETSRSKSGDNRLRPIGLSLFRLSLFSAPALPTSGSRALRVMLRAFRATRHQCLGPIPWLQASRFRPIFQVLFCRGPMLCRHALLLAISARGTPLRSGRGGDTASPAAAKSAVAGSA